MTAKQKRQHKLGNALRLSAGGQHSFQPVPGRRVSERIIRWNKRCKAHGHGLHD